MCVGARVVATLTLGALSLLVPWSAIAQTSVTTNRNDLARTGANLSEPTLNTTNVNATEFGKLFERAVDDEVYAQPLYVPNVDIPGVGLRNVLYVATMSDTVYAFDADDPAASTPLWRISYISPPSVVPVHHTDVGQTCGTYLDFAGNIGIVGTPVIDPVTQTMYFVVRTKENGIFRQRLHAIDIRDGSPRPQSPTLIEASVPGTGDGSVDGIIPFNAQTQNQRPGLMLLNGVVYIAWGSHCDQGPYQGWVMGYDASTLQQVMTFNVAPDGADGGIWQSGQALSADAAGNIYLVTGNGDVDAHLGGRNYGSSFVKISPNGTVLDWFTPHDFDFINATDNDLITGAVLIPGTNLAMGAAKQGTVYVLDRDNMGHFQEGSDSQIVQSFQGSSAGRMNGGPVFWNTPSNGPVVYLWPGGDPLKAFHLVNGQFDTTPIAQSPQFAPPSMPGGIMALSAFDSIPGTGILWATMSNDGDANNMTQPGILRAYDANDVTRELWNSQQNAPRDDLGNFAKFNPPTIANGKVYVATFSNKVVAYGLLGGGPGNQAPVVNAGPDQTIMLPATAALSGTATDDGNPNPPAALSPTWSKVTGPGAVTFSPATAFTTTASFSTYGTYVLRLSVCDGAACASDQLTVTVNPAPDTGTGLRGQYFNDAGNGTYFTTSVLSQVDPTVNFIWNSSPASGVQADNFSVQWMGQVQPPATGDYVFSTESDEGVRLWVNNVLVIDNWTPHADTINSSASIPLVANVLYNVRLEFFEGTGTATARLMWTPPGGTSQVVPQTRLFPAPPLNQPPIVNAGADQIISLPNTLQVTGTVSDDGQPNPPGSSTYLWSNVGGREGSESGVVFSNPNALTTTVSFPASGIYVLRLSAFDGALTSSDDVVVTVNPAPSGGGIGLLGEYFNDPDGNSHFTTQVLSRVDSTVNFDWGVDAPDPAVQVDNFSVRWTGRAQAVVSGSHIFTTSADDGVRLWIDGQLVIDNWVDQPETMMSSAPITLNADQLYDIRMEFYDREGGAVAHLMWSYPGQPLTVIPQSQLYPPSGPSNAAPTVSAGADATITLPNGATLSGTVSDDGLPTPPGAVTVAWSKVSGPGTVTFSAPGALSTVATFSTAGVYVVRLTASDGSLSTSDEATVVVNPAPVTNQAPSVNAGVDQAITLPATATLLGTATDDGLPNPPGVLAISWSVVSGPGSVTFTNPAALGTSATFSAAGVYVIRLSASDGVLTSSDDVAVTVSATGGGTGGLTGEYYDGVDFATLLLTRIDPVVDFTWGRGSPDAIVPDDNFSVRWTGTVRAPVSGSYTFATVSDDGIRLWVNGQLLVDNWTDHGATTDTSVPLTLTAGINYAVRLEFYERTGGASARLLWSYPGQSQTVIPSSALFSSGSGTSNTAPVVNAGADQTITLPASAALTGSASDDGLPAAMTTMWTVVSGPGTVTFVDANALSTTASFSTSGTYVLRLTASDSVLSTSDDVTVTVNPAPSVNQAPTVNAGPDQTITLPASATLTGTASDDGLPNPPATLTTTWSRVSGPGTVTFGNANALSTTASFSTSGTYVLRLTASDSVLSASDDITVTVNPAPPVNQAPTVNAGPDQTITLPASAALAGTASDDGLPNPPAAITTTWSVVSGPGTVTFGNATALSTTASFSTSGTYVLRLTASDSVLTSTDDVVVTVNASAGGAGTGLTGQYYDRIDFATLLLTRIDPTIDFNWGRAAPDPLVPDDKFSVRWTGSVRAPVSGSYTFATVSDDGIRLWVSGQLLIDNWTDHGPTTNTSAPVTLVAGVAYDVRVEFYEWTSGAVARLLWSYPGQSQIVIPSSALFPSAPSNVAPAVNAGADQTITLPANATLTGAASDDGLPNPPATITTAWSVVSGPGTVTFGNANALSTTASFSTSGTFVLRLTASDGALTSTDDVTVTVNPAPAVNQAPTVNAGPDQTITLPASATLVGAASDDGLPNPPATVTTTWSVVSGPGTVTFGNANTLSTTASFSTSGTYVLRLTASDSVLSTSDDITVTVNPAPPVNQAPAVNAGPDQTITLPASATLAGTANDDGLPNPPATVTTTWSVVSGPGTVTFGNANALSTTATFSTSGTYALRLTASDSVLTSTDDVIITVNAATGGAGTGLTGRYYDGIDFGTLLLTRLDPTVDFAWGRGTPDPLVPDDNFSVRWTGSVRAPVSGNYTFTTVSDDGVRVWVNGQLVIDNWTDHAPTTNDSAPIALVGGVSYAIVVEYYEGVSGATMRLQWSYPGQSTVAIPQSQLFP